MKNIRSLFLILSLALGLQSTVFSQLSDVSFLKGGPADAQALFQEYLTPYANIFGADLNAGWYNSGKVHKLGGFDLTLTVNTAWAPPSARTFDASLLNLSPEAQLSGGSIAPTIAGKRDVTPPTLQYFGDFGGTSVKIAEFDLPKGTGVNMIPLPMAQLTVGGPWGTDVSFRYLPSIPLGKAGTIGLWGIGGRHSILQHIPALKKLPVLDITAQGGYTKLTTYANINYDPSSIGTQVQDYTTNTNQWADQKLEMVAGAWTVNLIVSETLPVISFYQAIGYSSSTVNLGLNGNYPFPRLATSGPHAGEVVVEDADIVKDPLQFEMQNNKDLRLNAGFRLKLGVVTIQFDYTKANYSVFTTGLGISFR
ncbi:MAG: hypothetical protein H6538_08590 [Bacteroidales bacterium]|nr:hypothetical protein [Bacteroidales bacterium]MCB9013844.1 hypothetical protein [Bacteroidales bacterium]